jgi:hypothetical protein
LRVDLDAGDIGGCLISHTDNCALKNATLAIGDRASDGDSGGLSMGRLWRGGE